MGMWMALFADFLPAIVGVGGVLPWIGPIAVVFMGAFAGHMYGFDGSALWLTLTTPGAERVDVRGRQLAWLFIVGRIVIMLTVLLSALQLVPVTNPHRRGRSVMVAGDDLNAGRLQVEGLLSLALMLVLAAPTAVVTIVGVAMHFPGLEWAGIATGMSIGLVIWTVHFQSRS